MKVCVITDNEYIFENFVQMTKFSKHEFSFFFSEINKAFKEKYKEDLIFQAINLKKQDKNFFEKYDLFMSLHSKQLFPSELVENKRCINVHPGLNPFNRGWFPQVFSIVNKKPIGVTIHEMDCELDHGPIIYQKKIDIHSYETSFDVYTRIQKLEIELLKEHLEELICGNYMTYPMSSEGNINFKSDFDELCKINLDKKASFGEFIDVLRATTFDKYDNAYFIDDNGEKVYVSIKLKRSE